MSSNQPVYSIDQLREIILASLDFEEAENKKKASGEIAEKLTRFVQVRKQQVMAYCETGDTSALNNLYNQVTHLPRVTANLEYIAYIKAKAGIDIDLFGNLEERVNLILAKDHISNKKEFEDICSFMELRRKTNFDLELHDRVGELFSKYHNWPAFPPPGAAPVISQVYSPDKKRKALVHKTTSVDGRPMLDVWVNNENGGALAYACFDEGQQIEISWDAPDVLRIKVLGDAREFYNTSEIKSGDANIRIITA